MQDSQKALPVVAALIMDPEGRCLLCQRSEHMKRPLHWEFPGGKIEAGETGEAALRRECMEELKIGLDVGAQMAETVWTYPDVTVRLTLYLCHIQDGTPTALEHRTVSWVASENVADYALCPADRELWKQCQSLVVQDEKQ